MEPQVSETRARRRSRPGSRGSRGCRRTSSPHKAHGVCSIICLVVGLFHVYVLWDSEEPLWSGWIALRGALEAGGP